MELSLHNQGRHFFTFANDGLVSLNSNDYHDNIIVDNDAIIAHSFANVQGIDLDSFANYLTEFKPQLVIFATKDSISKLPKDIVKLLISQQIGFEVMSVVAASRTFNFLIGEDRKVSCVVFLSK